MKIPINIKNKDLIVFIQHEFNMSWAAASHLSREKGAQELQKMKDFYKQKSMGIRSYTSKKWICCGKVTFL